MFSSAGPARVSTAVEESKPDCTLLPDRALEVLPHLVAAASADYGCVRQFRILTRIERLYFIDAHRGVWIGQPNPLKLKMRVIFVTVSAMLSPF
jgi:hypothetical protein